MTDNNLTHPGPSWGIFLLRLYYKENHYFAMYLIRDTYPKVWGHDKDPWTVTEQGNLLLFTNTKCRQSYLTQAGSSAARKCLDRGMPPSYAVQHAELE